MRVLLLASYLGVGGAERQLLELAKQLGMRGQDVRVALFYRGGEFETDLVALGIPLLDLRKRGAWDISGSRARLIAAVDSIQADVLYSYLAVPNIYAGWVKDRRPNVRVVWGIRGTTIDTAEYGVLGRIGRLMEDRLANRPDIIICNSHAGRHCVVRRGFPAERLRVVHNGIDTGSFQRDALGRSRVRAEWNIAADQFLIGLVARIDPMKDHLTFLRSAELAGGENPSLRFVIVGDGPARLRNALARGPGPGAAARMVWAGMRSDMSSIYSALDLCVLSSAFGEGFPNAVAEAMACETPCVVTDVGDAGLVVGDTGRVVPPRCSEALARSCQEMACLPSKHRLELGRAARRRVEREFSLEALAERTLAALTER